VIIELEFLKFDLAELIKFYLCRREDSFFKNLSSWAKILGRDSSHKPVVYFYMADAFMPENFWAYWKYLEICFKIA